MYGLDIGGTKTEFAVFDDDLQRLHTRRVETPVEDYARLVRSILELVQEADSRFTTVKSIGIGLPGIRDRRGRSFSVNVPCITARNVKNDLSAVLGRTVEIINDGRAFALSEAHGGAGRGRDPMVGVILGSGVFGGYCIGGNLQAGTSGIAGEWGHLAISATVRERFKLPLYQCGCGKLGCIENYVSGRGLSQLHAHVAESPISPRRLVQRMRAGDRTCRRAFDIWIECLASCFAQLTLYIDPEIIVVGGGLSKIDELYSLVPPVLVKHLFGGVQPPGIVPAGFGDASGVRGAAIFAARRCAGPAQSPHRNPSAPST